MGRLNANIKKHKMVDYGKYGYLFIAPFFITYLLFSFWPLLYTIGLSFMENYTDPLFNKEVGPTFNGFDNFKTVLIGTDGKWFSTPTFKSLYNTAFMWLVNFVPQILLALLLAAWFTDVKLKLKGQGAYKVIIFMPNIITASTLAVLFYSLFNFPSGPVNLLLQQMGFMEEGFNFYMSKTATRLIVAFIQFWMWYGNTMIILIAGILGINPALYEAAMVDGASSKQVFFTITLPLLKPIMLFTLVTSAIGGLQMYDIPMLLTTSGNGDPDNATRTITMYIRQMAFTGAKQMGKASAVSMVLFVVTLALSLFLFYIMRDKDVARERKEARGGAKKV